MSRDVLSVVIASVVVNDGRITVGVNNRQRRAAKRRKKTSAGAEHSGRTGGRRGAWYGSGSGQDEWSDPWAGSRAAHEDAAAAGLVLRALAEVEADPRTAQAAAEHLVDQASVLTPGVLARTVQGISGDMVRCILAAGWTPADLGEIVRRSLSARHLPPVAALLRDEADQHPHDRIPSAWRAQLAELGVAAPATPTTATGLELLLGVWALFHSLPRIEVLMSPPGAPAPAATVPAGHPDAKQLARVRALLVKAESTEYDEEAEALSAKAQELISRYALQRMLNRAGQEGHAGPVTARRLWIDQPYVSAKSMLVHAVAEANRCQSVLSESLGFCTLIGEPADLEAVELLVTSLLVQANAAMLRYGQQADRRGTSRTRSFRRSFLIAYASRIGERLMASTEEATAQTGRVSELLPVLRSARERVEDACTQMFPQTVSREVSVSNGMGWAAGRAAADLALLDARLNITGAAS
jgi:hypothetical protein